VAGVCGTIYFFGNTYGWWPSLYHALTGRWNFLTTWGLYYIIPVVVACAIAWFIRWKGFTERPYLRQHEGDESFGIADWQAQRRAAKAGTTS